MAEFENRLRRDLPRGHGSRAEASGFVTAHWLQPQELAEPCWQPRGVLLGQRMGRWVGWDDDRHLVTIAGNRAGKGVSLLVPNLLGYQGSAIVIDPKGELTQITAGRRGMGTKAGGAGLQQLVFALDPFGENRRWKSACFNPLDELNADSDEAIADAGMMADALIQHPEYGERHWSESAQGLLQALILLVTCHAPQDRNLPMMRDLLTLCHPLVREAAAKAKSSEMSALLALLETCPNEKVARKCWAVARQFRDMGERERGSVLSTARTQTDWLDDPPMRAMLGRSDFALADLKRKRVTVYLCLPSRRKSTHYKWLRLMIGLALTALERTPGKPQPPVLFLLEEFPTLGHMRSVEQAAGLMAGFGVKLWTVMQDLSQLREHYPKSWETFVANAGVLTAWGNPDENTKEYLSKKLGRTTLRENVATGASLGSMLHGNAGTREDLRDVALLAPHEIERVFAREMGRLLVKAAGRDPLILSRAIYYADTRFAGLFDPPLEE
jgi:type IV secretion system protein VirD4